ncbi:flagellar protein FliT [Clostridium sp.]|uniref:flagellar protein FliT n=1 Tax=Clostridium sp. TaxID=1506 RepID=UPI002FC71A69
MVESILESYKKITEETIENLKNDIDISKLMDKREDLIKELFEDEKINKDYIKDVYLSMGLLKLDEKLKLIIKEEQAKVKEEIRSLYEKKNANNIYGKNINTINIFSKKI